jgi:hypothetical protein
VAFDFLKIGGAAQTHAARGPNPNGVTVPKVSVTDVEKGLGVSVQGNKITVQGRAQLMGSQNAPDAPPITFSLRRPDGESVAGEVFYPYNAGPEEIAQKMIEALPLGYELAYQQNQVSGGQISSSTFEIVYRQPSRTALTREIQQTEGKIAQLTRQVDSARVNVGWATRAYARDVNGGAKGWAADKSLRKVHSADHQLDQARTELAIAQARLQRLQEALPGSR